MHLLAGRQPIRSLKRPARYCSAVVVREIRALRTEDDVRRCGGESKVKTQVHLFTHTESSGIFWEPSTVKGLSKSFRISDLKKNLLTGGQRGRKKYPRMYGKGHDHKKKWKLYSGETQKISISGANERATSAGGAEHPTSVTPEAASDLIF